MSKPRLTKEQKKIRKELIKYYKGLPAKKTNAAVAAAAIAIALAIQELIKRKD